MLKEIKDKFVYFRDSIPENDYIIQSEQMRFSEDPDETVPVETNKFFSESLKFIDIVDVIRRYSNSGIPSNPGTGKGCYFYGEQNILGNAVKAKNMIKNLIENFEDHIDPKDPTNNCLDVAIITAPEKRTKKTIDKLKNIAGRVLNK